MAMTVGQVLVVLIAVPTVILCAVTVWPRRRHRRDHFDADIAARQAALDALRDGADSTP